MPTQHMTLRGSTTRLEFRRFGSAHAPAYLRCGVLLLLTCALLSHTAWTVWGSDRRGEALKIRSELVQRVMPYWHDTTLDHTNGGFILADDGSGNPHQATEKQLVTQARMIWGFSHAHLHGLADGHRDYLAAAAQGREFLRKHFWDARHGGYFWTTDLAGVPVSRNKIVYGQAFVIYALVEYYRASGDKTALNEAMDLYQLLQKHAHDQRNRGLDRTFLGGLDADAFAQPGGGGGDRRL